MARCTQTIVLLVTHDAMSVMCPDMCQRAPVEASLGVCDFTFPNADGP